jgi:nucleoside-diphosphate-sugar epimerase
MRIFVTGATGARGWHLVPGLVAAGHEVTATTTPGKVAQLREAGAEPVVVDGLDREAVIAAVRAAAPEVIVHQMTALADMRSLRNADRVFAATDELRTRGTDNLLAAAARAGTVAEWLPYLAQVAGAKPPLRLPTWLGRLLAGEFVVAQMTTSRGSSNEKARKELRWEPRYASWREGFRAWVRG